jgi:phthalate 4,5-dioxygenase
MLSQADNELMTHVGPGTPVGDLMRQYWIPALKSAEIPEPDGRPLRVRLLGENLIAFRATSGEVGMLPNNCPHRGASLFFGRNEGNGLRCVYHGWKYDVRGRCVDMPNEPPESNFKDKIRAGAYPVQERNGIIWTYMGSHATPPALPDLEPNMLPGCHVITVQRECNWLQALEGDIDTSHFGFLHLGSVTPEMTRPGSFDRYAVTDRAPRYEVVDTDSGTLYGAYRPAEQDSNYWRIASFLFPFYTMVPVGVLGLKVNVRAWVPLDDEHTMYWSMDLGRQGELDPGSGRSSGRISRTGGSGDYDYRYVPNTTDWLGRWRLEQNRSNDFLLDPELQKTASYTGIRGIYEQDQAITESMGPLVNRAEEHLGSADVMVIRTRQRILRAALALRDAGLTPPGVDDPAVYRGRSGGALLPRGVDWLEATAERRKAFVEHPELRSEADSGRF